MVRIVLQCRRAPRPSAPRKSPLRPALRRRRKVPPPAAPKVVKPGLAKPAAVPRPTTAAPAAKPNPATPTTPQPPRLAAAGDKLARTPVARPANGKAPTPPAATVRPGAASAPRPAVTQAHWQSRGRRRRDLSGGSGGVRRRRCRWQGKQTPDAAQPAHRPRTGHGRGAAKPSLQTGAESVCRHRQRDHHFVYFGRCGRGLRTGHRQAALRRAGAARRR